MTINRNIKIGLIISISLLALFVLSLVILQQPHVEDNSARFGVLTIIPPLVAILLAFITKETILSLFLGVFVGEFMICVSDTNIFSTIVNSFLNLCSHVLSSISDPWNAGILLQCLLIGGVIQLIANMGGTRALAETLSQYAKSPKSAQIITWFLGICVFFDDYANSLIVGPIMRPVTDKLHISREKLAFIVDSTAAPIAGIMIISTWIGLELSLIQDGLNNLGFTSMSAFGVFLQTIPYRFYNIFVLIFIVITAITLYEFGPMKNAEIKARKRKDNEAVIENNETISYNTLEPAENAKITIWNAIIPIGTLIIGSLIAFYWSGYCTILEGTDQTLITLMKTAPLSSEGIFEALSASDASIALFQAALLASIVAIVMSVAEKICTIGEAINTWVEGMKPIVITCVILLLAWSLGTVINEVGTANYLVTILSSTIPYWSVPTLIFLLDGLISFATGTAYGTMTILMPLAIPLAWNIKPEFGFLICCISAVLTGAIFGDHCSPISDTTIMSSMGSGCDHINHVNTQISYSIFVAIIVIAIGYIPAGFGVPWYISLILGCIAIYIGLRILGEKVPAHKNDPED